jgi:nucleoside-diphosphate-sugar epimerase
MEEQQLKNLLVTGGCGFIGSVLVRELLDNDYNVTVYDKLYFGDDALDGVKDEVEIIQGDLRDFDPSILDGIDGVIHLGSLSNDPTAEFDPEANQTINFDASVNLAKECKKAGISRFTYASSAATYGFYVDGIADEETPVDPKSEYARTKVEVDYELQELADDSFHPVAFRQATVFGLSPRMRWDLVINAFVMHAFRSGELDVWFGGEAWRPHVHIKDVAQAHMLGLEEPAEKVSGEIFNVVGSNYKIIEAAHRVEHALREVDIDVDIEVDYSEEDHRSYQVSSEKIRSQLGFEQTVTIQDSAKRIARALKNGDQPTDFDRLKYYNIDWMEHLVEMEELMDEIGYVF